MGLSLWDSLSRTGEVLGGAASHARLERLGRGSTGEPHARVHQHAAMNVLINCTIIYRVKTHIPHPLTGMGLTYTTPNKAWAGRVYPV